MTKYKVLFTGTKGECHLFVDSPLTVDSDHEKNVDAIIDLAVELGYIEFGENFREELDTFAISLIRA